MHSSVSAVESKVQSAIQARDRVFGRGQPTCCVGALGKLVRLEKARSLAQVLGWERAGQGYPLFWVWKVEWGLSRREELDGQDFPIIGLAFGPRISGMSCQAGTGNGLAGRAGRWYMC